MMSVEHEGAHVHRHVILFILGDSSTHFKAHSHDIIWRQKHRWCAMVGDSSDCDAKQCCFMKLGSRRCPPKWRECQLKTWCEVLSFCRFVCVRLSFPVCRLSFAVCRSLFAVSRFCRLCRLCSSCHTRQNAQCLLQQQILTQFQPKKFQPIALSEMC